MRSMMLAVCVFAFGWAAFAQSDRGTITGTVSDPVGAVVNGAAIEIRNTQTGATYQAASSATGNYTLAQLPAGSYEISVIVPGFKKYVRQNLTVDVAQTYRVDAVLEVGANSESVTITEAAPLLKTESGELSHNVNTETMNSLPVLSIGSGAGTGGIRNPFAVLQLIPGGDFRADSSIRINGTPSNTQTLRIEGQESNNAFGGTTSQTAPSVDAIQEFAIQTSNYAAEFGQAGGGVFNVTMKSGTNSFHGTAYEYFVNEDLNAGVPFTNSGNGHLLRPRQRRNDYGFTVGGPIMLPKLYDGHNKAFFFFNFEQYRETIITNNVPTTVPNQNYRIGNFSQALTNRSLGTDGLGRPLMENTVYDPATDHLVNGVRYRDPFPNNTIPMTRIDPVALKVEQFFPAPTNSGLINNYLPVYSNPRLTYIPSVKIDYSLSDRSKISGYWSRTSTDSPNNGAFPFPIATGVPSHVVSHTIRINFDQTLTPTLLWHAGIGVVDTVLDQPVQSYDPVAGIGLKGTYTDLFPVFQGLTATTQGGMANIGPGTANRQENTKPTANTSLTWVRNNHTYKAGGEVRVEGFVAKSRTYANAYLVFDPSETGLPALSGVGLPATVGFNYASFLLGSPDHGFIGVPSDTRVGSHNLSGFVQDTWKVTRKLTIDYGLRYDFETYPKEQYGRTAIFSPSTPNPAAGGRLGAVAFDGSGPGHCDCSLAHNYPFAFGPRIGLAYQLGSKTVLRVGSGISYGRTDDNNALSSVTGSLQLYQTASYGDPAYLMSTGLPYHVVFPNLDPGQTPLPGTTNSPQVQLDQNAGRPPRIFQWSIGAQREISKNIVVEAAYVGNRGAWWNSNYMVNPNLMTAAMYAAVGLDINNPADQQLITSPINSQLAASRGFNKLPYAGFPAGATVGQSLRPFPQFLGLTNFHYSPTGDTWYDSLQTKLTKRYSHGLDFSSSFTWSKQLTIGAEEDSNIVGPNFPGTNDITNRGQNKYLSGFDQPLLFVFAGNYTTPNVKGMKFIGGKAPAWVLRDWTLGTVLRYGSGFPIMVPTATNGINNILFRQTGNLGTTGGTYMNRVPGQPLFTEDLNCHCFDPTTTFVLNPKAWANPAPYQFGTSAAYYSDYRYARRPVENMSFGRVFRVKEKMSLQVRAEFTNIFNRTQVNNPSATNALATQSRSTSGLTTAGFGYVSTATTFSAPRQGQLVARFTF